MPEPGSPATFLTSIDGAIREMIDMMNLSDLAHCGIPGRVIERWERRFGDHLLPVQRRAVRRGLLTFDPAGDGGGNLVISAPTSSGKSFCAEMAFVKALTDRRHTIIAVPLKSLAEQTAAHYRQTYGDLGLRIVTVSADHPENDRAFLNGEYDLALAIYEKLDRLLTARLDILSSAGLVVIDELQMISEPVRGAILERLLSKIMASSYVPKLLGLSAVLGDEAARPLAAWLRAELIEECSRPVDLLRGVAVAGSFRFASYNTGCRGEESLTGWSSGDDAFAAFARQLSESRASVLVFLKSRHETIEAALRVAAAVTWPPAARAVVALGREEPSYLVRSLSQALSRGVAFHNSDLSPAERQIVETAFAEGEARVLFSTTTLSLGVNLPADVVYLEPLKYESGRYGRRPNLVPISRADFDNMAGRAGRLGLGGRQPGRAVMLAETEFDRDVLWENYIAVGSEAGLTSVWQTLPAEDWLLDWIASGLVRSGVDIEGVWQSTLAGGPLESAAPDWTKAAGGLEQAGLIRSSDEHLSPTPLGTSVAQTGLSYAGAVHLSRQLSTRFPETELGWLALALSVPDFEFPPGLLTRYEMAENAPLRLLYRRFEVGAAETACLLPDADLRGPLPYAVLASVKCLMLLTDWSAMVPLQTLEERYQVHHGQILRAAEGAAHVLASLAAMVAATDRDSPTAARLREEAFAVKTGLSAALEPLHRRLHETANRRDLIALSRAGYESPADVHMSDVEDLTGILADPDKAKRICQQLAPETEECDMQVSMTGAARPVSGGRPDLLEIDGAFDRERYLVRINGQPVRLTGKSFKYLAKLAWSRVNQQSGWVYKEDIETGFNQARYLYRMKNEITSSFGTGWGVVENNRLGYYRLNLDPDRIRINVNNMRQFPDHDISSLFESSAPDSRELN